MNFGTLHASQLTFEMHRVLQLRGTEHGNQLRLLELFAYGTYADYKAVQSEMPLLRPGMLDKLRMLTIVTLAQEQRIVTYSQLQQTLEVQYLIL
jgi:COP9 signalosome complex subunit 7